MVAQNVKPLVLHYQRFIFNPLIEFHHQQSYWREKRCHIMYNIKTLNQVAHI